MCDIGSTFGNIIKKRSSFRLIFKLMIKEQNYAKVAEYTRKAFQVFSRRVLAAKLIEVLSKSKLKKQLYLDADSDLGMENDSVSNDIPQDRKNQVEQLEGKSSNIKFTKQMFNRIKETKIRISKVCYGDLVEFQLQGQKETCRMATVLKRVKFFSIAQIPLSYVNSKKMVFELCSSYSQLGEKGHPITADSMVCLRSVFTGDYLTLSEEVMQTSQLGYSIVLAPQISKQSVFRIITKNPLSNEVSTDHLVCLNSYYKPQLYFGVNEAFLDTFSDRILIGTYNPSWLRLFKRQDQNLKSFPFYFVSCVGINKKVSAQFVPFASLIVRKEFNRLELDNEKEGKTISNYNETYAFSELGDMKFCKDVEVCDDTLLSLYQVWEIEVIKRNEEGMECKIINSVTGQSLSPQLRDSDYPDVREDCVFHLRRQSSHRNHYMILNDQKQILCAVYDGDKQGYILRFEQELSGKSVGVNKSCVAQFCLQELQSNRGECLVALLQCYELLKSDYPFIERWGFRYDQHEFKLFYSVTELKTKLLLMRGKINQLLDVIQKLKQLVSKQDNNALGVKDMTREARILELLILYCKIINIKMDNKTYRAKQMYKLARAQLKGLQEKIFDIIYLLVYNNKDNSEVIIEHSPFFNHMLSLYPDIIGALLEESIKNLCLLTTKISREELVLFEWTKLVQFLPSVQVMKIQRKYIDIISEVAIDPNDIGITPYQNKIKEQIFTRHKKKIFPKYVLDEELGPLIIFEYQQFPIKIELIHGPSGKCFQLKNLFKEVQCTSQIEYLSSCLKLMRNLCKDRNRKMPKVCEDYGLTQQYMHGVFRSSEIGWELVARFLDLYCSMYLVQDPFLSFQKREVKCFAWQKIQSIDFGLKTAILFKQFTEEHIAQDKLKQFDLWVLPLLDKYFKELMLESSEREESIFERNSTLAGSSSSFFVFVSVVYEIVNYGYLSQSIIGKYLGVILRHAEIILSEKKNVELRRKILEKVIALCRMGQQINTIIHGMNLLKKIYISFSQPVQPNRQQIADIFQKALQADGKCLEEEKDRPLRRKRTSMVMRSTRMHQQQLIDHQFSSPEVRESDIIRFILGRITESRYRINNASIKQLLSLLSIINMRGERICQFLTDLLIFNSIEEQNLYLQYSGITPLGFVGEAGGSSRRLLNVMKVKELVEKITEESLQSGQLQRKKQKIYELNNLMSKILSNLQHLKKKNRRLFRVCQLLLQKLKMHSILALIFKFQEQDTSQELIGEIVKFYCQFVEENQENLNVLVPFFPDLTKRYAYQELPRLLSLLFGNVSNQEQSFELIFCHLGKKMKQNQKQILFASIYKILKICPRSLFDNLKGKVIYALTSFENFASYVKGQQISMSFISLLCFVGGGICGVHQKIKDVIKKSELLRALQSQKTSYELKGVYLRLYHFLYIEFETKFDEVEISLVIEKVFLAELKYLPASCRFRASAALSSQQNLREHGPGVNQLMKQLIHSEFENLLKHGSEVLPASEEQSYFYYLLGMEQKGEFGLLSCLSTFISKFKVYDIDNLASYVFKLINFMDKISFNEHSYHSRILSKLYLIGQIITKKYNRSNMQGSKQSYLEAYPIVQKFYQRIASIIQKDSISYHKILKCAEVTHLEVVQARLEPELMKLVPLSQFLKFIREITLLVNNKEEFLELSESTVKQFFCLIKQKGSYQIDMKGFICKLLSVLQFQKNSKLVLLVNENRRSQSELSLTNLDKYSLINRDLIKNQIKSYCDTFEMMLQHVMTDKIEKSLEDLLEMRKMYECANGCHTILDLHQIGEEYDIINLLIAMMLADLTSQECCQGLKQSDLSKYLTFLLKYSSRQLNTWMVKVMRQLYVKIKVKNQLVNLFSQFLLQSHPLIVNAVVAKKDCTFEILQSFFQLVGQMSKNGDVPHLVQVRLGQSFANLLILCFANHCNSPQNYWLQCCQLLLSALIKVFQEYSSIACALSSDNDFISNVVGYFTHNLSKTILSTNSIFCRKLKVISKICLLIIEFRAKGLKKEVAAILAGWPFQFLFQVVQSNYKIIVNAQINKWDECSKKQGCTSEFCNEGRVTAYDSEKTYSLTNMLTVVFMAADLKEMGLLESKSLILETYLSWQKGCKQKIPEQYVEMFRLINCIELKLANHVSCVYFALPLQSGQSQLECRMEEEIKLFKKQRYLENIYKLSFYVEKELDNQASDNFGVLSRNYKTISECLHLFFILYLLFACFLKIYNGLRSSAWSFFLNGIVFVLKFCLLGFELRHFLKERATLSSIQYQNYTIFWKYSRMLSSFAVLVCYLLLFFVEQLYPIALFLELYRVKLFEQVANYLMEGIKISLFILVPYQIMILFCSFLVVKQGYPDTVGNVFLKLQYQVVKFSSVTLIAEDTQYYNILRYIPEYIPFFQIMMTFGRTFFIACILHAITKRKQDKTSSGDICMICGGSRGQFEGKGTNFSYHLQREHNIWSYIYFFIFMRRSNGSQLMDRSVNLNISKQDFRFLHCSNDIS